MTSKRVLSRITTCWQAIMGRTRRNGAVAAHVAMTILAIMIVAQPLFAQINGGSIAGNVLDPQGSVIAGAKIRVTKVDTGESQATQSTGAGSYRFDNLNPGTYSVSAEAKGFRSSKVDNVLVTISTTIGQDIHLQVGSATESVTVTVAGAQLETESSDIGTSVGPKLVVDLPIAVNNGEMRSVIDFMFLAPGVVGGENDNKIAGGQVTGSTVEVDGGSVDSITGANFDVAGYTPSVDAVQEFTILEGGYSAQYGRTTGGITNFATKSGTNQYHGLVYDYFTNAGLNANSWFNNLEAAANPSNASLYRRPADTKNEYGLTFGGPVVIPHLYNGHNRTFFFFSWEQFRQTNGNVAISTVPTVANRNGDFTATLTTTVIGTNPCNGQPIYQGEIFDPATTTQVGNTYCRLPFDYNGQLNMINPARFSTVAQNVLSYMPLPQNSSLLNNYAFRNTVPYLITAETIRIDHTFSAKDKIFGSYNPHEQVQSNEGEVIPGPASPFLYLTQALFTHDAHIGYDHAFTPATLNHAVLSLYRFTNFPVSPASAAGIDYSQKLGLGSNLGGTLFPSFGWGENYIGLGSWLQYKDYQSRIELADNVVHIIGKHTLNIGADARYQQFARNFQLFESGSYNFGRGETAGTNSFTTLSGNGFASFLLGQVSSASADVEAVAPQFLQHYYAVYAQDDYKPIPTLTINLGIRYDVDLPFSVKRNEINNWDPTLPDTNLGINGGLVFAGTGPGRAGISSRFANTDYKDFGPRLGFAWSPKELGGKTVFRGNYGIVYGAVPMNIPANGDPGFTDAPNFTDSLEPGGFTQPFNLDSGFPAFFKGINFDPFQLDNTGSAAPYAARSFGKRAMVQNYGLEVQQALGHSFLASLAYNGNRSTRLSSNLLCLDCLSPQYYGLGSQLSQTFSPTRTMLSGHNIPYAGFTGSLAQGLEPFPQIGGITTYNENQGQSSYNALYAKLQRSFTNGLSVLVSYSWSKTLTDADTTLIGQEPGGAQDPFDFHKEKSVSALDYPQVFAASYVYELPFGKNKQFLNHGNLLNELVGGWEISGIHNLESGSPANFACATGLPGDSPCFRFSVNPGVPIYSAAKLSGHFNPLTDFYFNPAAFTDPNSNARISAGGGYQYGNLRRNVGFIRFPTSPNSSFGFIKHFAVTHGSNVEFRGEMFNAFNQHRLGGANTNPNVTSFGQISGTQNSARTVQLVLRINF
jgi:hypothetical protein